MEEMIRELLGMLHDVGVVLKVVRTLQRVYIAFGREDGLLALLLFLKEPLEGEELGLEDLVFEVGEPALVQRVDLELQQVFLLGSETLDPFVLVERFGLGVLGLAEEGSYAAVGLGLFGVGASAR